MGSSRLLYFASTGRPQPAFVTLPLQEGLGPPFLLVTTDWYWRPLLLVNKVCDRSAFFTLSIQDGIFPPLLLSKNSGIGPLRYVTTGWAQDVFVTLSIQAGIGPTLLLFL